MEPLTLVEMPAPTSPYWSPFGECHDGYTERWWTDMYPYEEGQRSWFAVHRGKREVGRIELRREVQLDHYAPQLDDRPLLSIDFFQIKDTEQRAGNGRQAVALLVDTFPGWRLFALSEDADHFWSALGWHRVDHPTEPMRRPLFLAP